PAAIADDQRSPGQADFDVEAEASVLDRFVSGRAWPEPSGPRNSQQRPAAQDQLDAVFVDRHRHLEGGGAEPFAEQSFRAAAAFELRARERAVAEGAGPDLGVV